MGLIYLHLLAASSPAHSKLVKDERRWLVISNYLKNFKDYSRLGFSTMSYGALEP